jgi:hypothetical protein
VSTEGCERRLLALVVQIEHAELHTQRWNATQEVRLLRAFLSFSFFNFSRPLTCCCLAVVPVTLVYSRLKFAVGFPPLFRRQLA